VDPYAEAKWTHEGLLELTLDVQTARALGEGKAPARLVAVVRDALLDAPETEAGTDTLEEDHE